MLRKEKQVNSPQEIDAIIYRSQVCRLALARDNQPYMVPLCFGYDGTALYVHTAMQGLKIEYFETNPNICFELESGVKVLASEEMACKWSFKYESVIGFGTIAELIDQEERLYGLNQIMHHYSGREWTFDEKPLRETRIWKITIDSLTAKKSTL